MTNPEFPDVLCINCEDMINYEKVPLHSSICTKPSSQVIKMLKSNYHYQIQYRINKLKSAIESIAYSERFLLSPEQEKTVHFLINTANSLIEITDPSITAINQATEISSILKKESELINPSLLIYSERLRNLAIEKTYYFLEFLSLNKESESIKSFLLSKTQEINQVRKQINFYSKRSLHLHSLLKSFERIDEVKSQIESSKTINSSLSSPMIDGFSLKNEIDELDSMFEKKKAEANNKSAQDLKKYFYSKCLLVKLNFDSRDAAQYIQISDLYQKIISENVPLQNWEEFIKDQFEHPERWVNLKLIPKLDYK